MENDARHRPAVLVIFGGGGDLTWRKLIPALFNLHLDKNLPQPFALRAVDRVETSGQTLASIMQTPSRRRRRTLMKRCSGTR